MMDKYNLSLLERRIDILSYEIFKLRLELEELKNRVRDIELTLKLMRGEKT